MTTLIAWLGADSRGPSSLNFAADSRFTWQPGVFWDGGKKLFASRRTPDMFGFCGDALFASQALSQTLELVESGLLFAGSSLPDDDRLNTIRAFVQQAFERLPYNQRRAFTAVYATRFGDGMESRFFAGSIDWSPLGGWSSQILPLPTSSGLIRAYGSGKSLAEEDQERWRKSDVGGTSRAVFSAFCEHLTAERDASTGGAPQLVGLSRKGPAVTFGTIFQGKKWLSGAAVPDDAYNPKQEWRDALFQRCDGRTMLPLTNAQRQPRPW